MSAFRPFPPIADSLQTTHCGLPSFRGSFLKADRGLCGMRLAAGAIILAISASALAGCSEGKPPFRMVQFCLTGPQEIPAFTSFMNEIAQEKRMEFFDRSGQTQDELRSLASTNKSVPVNDRAVNIGATRESDFSFGASNLGLPARQIAIGFNGDNLEAGQAFANEVVKKLSTRWRVHEVPEGRGALPLSRCD